MYQMNKEELLTAIGMLMADLRGDWSYDYSDRMETLLDLFDALEPLATPTELQDITTVRQVAKDEMSGESGPDGRAFRDEPFYYYASEEGKTERVAVFLQSNTHYPA